MKINHKFPIDRRDALRAGRFPVLSASSRSTSARHRREAIRCHPGTTVRPRRSILDFVARVTARWPDFVTEDQRIATFDNDGTLWIEQPMYIQLAFALDRVKGMAAKHPEWKTKQPFRAVLEGDMKALADSGEKGLVEMVAVTHAGMTTRVRRSSPNGSRHTSDKAAEKPQDRLLRVF